MGRARWGTAIGGPSHGLQSPRVGFAERLGVGDEGIGVRPVHLELSAGKPAERPCHARARGELRGERYRRAAVIAFYRRSDACPVLLEVLQPENSAHRTDVLRDGYGDFAFVKIAAPGAGQPSQRIGKPRDLEPAERGV